MTDDFQPDDDTLNRDRAGLLRFFQGRAAVDGVVIHPRGEERDMNLAQHVYWECGDEREFTVCWRAQAPPRLNGFVKRTGLNYERQLLYITSAIGVGFEPRLWRLYRGWMHQGMKEELALALIGEPPPNVAT